MKAPNGSEIQGTLETTPGIAACTVSETGTIDYHGGTKLDYDGQETIQQAGVDLFVCDAGHNWPLHHLIPDNADELSQDVLDAMQNEEQVAEALDALRKAATLLQRLTTNGICFAPSVAGITLEIEPLHLTLKNRTLALMKAELDAQDAG